MSPPLVLAIDGGNWKTDLALVRADGEVLALVRGPQSSPHHLGLEGSLGVLGDLLAHPLVGQAPLAERLTTELLTAGHEYLPQFESREPVG